MAKHMLWSNEDDLIGLTPGEIAFVKALWDIANSLDEIANKMTYKKVESRERNPYH